MLVRHLRHWSNIVSKSKAQNIPNSRWHYQTTILFLRVNFQNCHVFLARHVSFRDGFHVGNIKKCGCSTGYNVVVLVHVYRQIHIKFVNQGEPRIPQSIILNPLI